MRHLAGGSGDKMDFVSDSTVRDCVNKGERLVDSIYLIANKFENKRLRSNQDAQDLKAV